jgi:predicted GNAT superfamily acetyltransferase
MICLRDVLESDSAAILRLNDAEVQHTSPMDLDGLRLLHGMSSYSKVAVVDDEIAAFLIALREAAPYRNDNYEWFAARFARFLYVDRIVVSAAFAGRRIGSTLYRDLFDFARLHRVDVITCEYNIEPPNPASRAFHDRFGFTELGTQWLAAGSKKVSLQAAAI